MLRTYAEYMAFEVKAETKHDYVAGVVRERPAVAPEEARLQASIGAALGAALRGRPYLASLDVGAIYANPLGATAT